MTPAIVPLVTPSCAAIRLYVWPSMTSAVTLSIGADRFVTQRAPAPRIGNVSSNTKERKPVRSSPGDVSCHRVFKPLHAFPTSRSVPTTVAEQPLADSMIALTCNTIASVNRASHAKHCNAVAGPSCRGLNYRFTFLDLEMTAAERHSAAVDTLKGNAAQASD
jgi:hypothetical protein